MFKLNPILEAWAAERDKPKKYKLPRFKRGPKRFRIRKRLLPSMPNAANTPEYGAWSNMQLRCYYEGTPGYEHYGGRGIIVCERWLKNYTAFLNDMGPRPSNNHTLDRINVNGNYEPTNCRWATWSEQNKNRRQRKNNP